MKFTGEYRSLVNCSEVGHVSSILTDVLFAHHHYDDFDDGDHDGNCHDENGHDDNRHDENGLDDNGQKGDNDLDMTIHHVFIPPPGQILLVNINIHTFIFSIVIITMILISTFIIIIKTCKSIVRIQSLESAVASKRIPHALRGAKPFNMMMIVFFTYCQTFEYVFDSIDYLLSNF